MTGAATGIGRATADVLEARGFAVARNHLPGQAVSGYSAEADVSDPAAVNRMVQDVTRDLGPVSVLVANAAHMVMGAHRRGRGPRVLAGRRHQPDRHIRLHAGLRPGDGRGRLGPDRAP